MSDKQAVAIQNEDTYQVLIPLSGLTPVINRTGVAIDFIIYKNGTIELRKLKP